MHKPFVFLFFVLVIACKQKEKRPLHASLKKVSASDPVSSKVKLPPIKPDTILQIVKGYVDGQRFKVVCTSACSTYVLNAKNDTIYKEPEYAANIYFKDFNNDGYKDIVIGYMDNTPGVEELLLYVKADRTYKQVVDFSNFPASEIIRHTKYYYSYEHQGCADMNWKSDLFYIENFKVVKIGTIDGRECGDSGIKDGIYINKEKKGKKEKVTELPIKIIHRYNYGKWTFIKSYWYKNYKAFL